MNSCSRFAILSLFALFSLTGVCDPRDPEENAVTEVPDGHAIVNALISEPSIAERLSADGLSVSRMTRQVLQPGVTEYVLYVHTCAMCDPGRAKSGSVSIIEDERPTYMDAPIEYAVSFSIEGAEK